MTFTLLCVLASRSVMHNLGAILLSVGLGRYLYYARVHVNHLGSFPTFRYMIFDYRAFQPSAALPTEYKIPDAYETVECVSARIRNHLCTPMDSRVCGDERFSSPLSSYFQFFK